MHITGTLINYFIHCKRQCYLYYNKLTLEDESELVKIGKALHSEKNTEEVAIENIKIDKLKGEYLIELKKSDADIEAAKMQLLFYLYVLKKKGIVKKGKLEIIEKNKKSVKNIEIELDEQNEKLLFETLGKIEELLSSETVPMAKLEGKCKKCAYYIYCFI